MNCVWQHFAKYEAVLCQERASDYRAPNHGFALHGCLWFCQWPDSFHIPLVFLWKNLTSFILVIVPGQETSFQLPDSFPQTSLS